MSKIIYGVDPDSDKHGIAVYRNNTLCELLNMNTIQLYRHLVEREKIAIITGMIEIHMENPKGVSASSFSHMKRDSLSVKFKKSEGVGQVKQAQTSIEQMALELGIPVYLYKNSKCWKSGSDAILFKRVTGWTGRSNQETRSAAFFGYLACKKQHKI